MVYYWLSKDLIGISGGLNQYVFCGNNPVNFVDPSGLCEEKSIKECAKYSFEEGQKYGWPYAHVLVNAGITRDHGKGWAWSASLGKEFFDYVVGMANEDALRSAFQTQNFAMNKVGRSIPDGVTPEEWVEPYKNHPDGDPRPFYNDNPQMLPYSNPYGF